MMKSFARIGLVIAALGPSLPAFAAPVPRAFEPPPTLPGQGNVVALEAAVAPAVGGCRPQGSISRSGSIVSVVLSFVRGRFFINNPDPTDPQPDGLDPVELRSYGGCKSGPAIFVKPGDTLRVDLINQLAKDDPSCLPNPPEGLGLPALVGCFNTTNLHTHGLHVSPAGNSDNVLLNIAPQTKFPYEINIPNDHPAGTFWYHAHRHGSTAVQVASGASGVLVVKGERPYTPPSPQNPKPIADIDTVLHDVNGAPFKEQLFLFQQIAYACFANQPNQPGGPWQQIYTTQGLYNASSPANIANAPWTCPLATPGNPVSPGVVENFGLQLDSSSIWDTNGRFTSVNGIVQPTLTVPAGEIQRWRFVHAGIHDTINIQLVRATPVGTTNLIATSALSGNRQQQKADLLAACNASPGTLIPQFEIASDGLTRTKLRTVHASQVGGVLESNYMQPGYRSDVLVVFPSDGDYCLLNQAAPKAERVSNGNGGGQGPSTPQLLAYVHVRGGQPVTGDLQAYVGKALYDANPTLPDAVRTGLRDGDLRPWAPFENLAPPAAGSQQQQAAFAINFPAFTVNNASYDPDAVNFTREVNTTDDWLLSAQGEPHIFHIHVNPFQVIDVTTTNTNGQQISIYNPDGTCKPDIVYADKQQLANQYCGMWHTFRDTIIVENNYQIRVRTRYDRYIGEYVLHCHILDHEDAGMMANIAIVPDLNAPGGGLGMAGMRHARQPTATPAATPVGHKH
ncbi:multicopper oxidase family protein [Bradyrhizobium japonicum]|uniref:multicopper oxidase family protein n=1 Tax=Bradyrhizobium japonicum TaxID=375 RepID=UPI00209D2654|nr:multicopper oxidase domain-containing protein [Bradyrhizobium japonicum]MCP1766112.1 FtsP/CotA-like multicopper oxidase with cupredoxin domain [Bradyrhizobium japonicum]MCP1788250.1 FtsP/CotA-like multicopper oxidase with cupredoxin domain [Bradyrhizobium japonicum]MCP1810125.1 FtsP/CotA-like multicopper oxidase with cupredoxin domain [Bradyrhizobium japonicum]MCP1819059.1 FtsP/CotA-like multicopper oxidase with cupredoxin domain [Bradyrhizobium japonicum]MCP1869431.1 FtsP/CotA-like multico